MSDPQTIPGAGPVEREEWSRPTVDYLTEATEGGRLFLLHDAAVVAAAWTDDLTGLRKGYVEWADPVLADVSRRHLVAAAAAGWLDVDHVVMRVPPAPAPGIGCRYRTRYVAAAAAAELARPVPSDVLVRAPAAEEQAAVHRWLARAYADAYAGLCEPAVADVLDRVRMLFPLDDADTGTLVAVVGGRPIGHVTWLRSRSDDLTGIVHDELVDMLVEPGGQSAGAARAALLAGLGAARTPGLQLLGNVSYDDRTASSVYDRLLAGCWRPAYDLVEWAR